MRYALILILAAAAMAQTPPLRPVRVTLTSSATDTYAGTASPTITAYTTGQVFMFMANAANTGAASLNVDGVGALTIVKLAGGPTTTLSDNDIRSGQPVQCWYDGTNCQMLTQLGNAASGGSASTQTRAIYFPFGARNTVSSASYTMCAVTSATYTYVGIGVVSAALPDAANNAVICPFVIPPDWAGGAMSVKVFANNVYSTAQQFRVEASVSCVADGANFTDSTTLMAATSAASTLTSVAGTTAVTGWTISDIGVNGCATGRLAWLVIERDGAHADDTSTQTLPLSMAELRYTSNQ